MSIVFIDPHRDMQRWEEAVHAIDANIKVEIWPDIVKERRVQFAVCWQQPSHALEAFPNLQAICSTGAGVDHILRDETMPDDVPVCRIVSASLLQQMEEYVFNAVLNYQHNMYKYTEQRRQKVWQRHANKWTKKMAIGMMGLGALGEPVARQLANFGYPVAGWAKTKKEIEGVETFAGDDSFGQFIEWTNLLVCLLPLTAETEGILNIETFKKMSHPGYLINVARGEHLVEEDLIYALDKAWLEGACLDVFKEEPLPAKHPFWNRPEIMITPHAASITEPAEAAGQIVENYKRLLSGQPLLHTVDRQKGY